MSETASPLPTEAPRSVELPTLAIPSARALVARGKEFAKLKRALLTKEDYANAGGTWVVKRTGWRKLAAAFGLSDEVMSEHRHELTDGSFTWQITVRVTAPNGRYSEAVGSCASNERRFTHVEHDCRATAHTRAKNRAVNDILGGADQVADDSAEQETAETGTPNVSAALALWLRAKQAITDEGFDPTDDGLIAHLIAYRGDIRQAFRAWRVLP